MTNTSSSKPTIDFPTRTLPHGATPAVIGPYVGGEPLFLDKAQGPVEYEPRETLALKFPHHTADQIATLVRETPELGDRRIDELTIAGGSVTRADVKAIGQMRIRRLILGTRRGHKGFRAPFEFVGEVDLSAISMLSSFEAHAVGLTEHHLETLPQPEWLGGLVLDESPVSPKLLSRFFGLEMLSISGVDGFGEDLSFVKRMPNLVLLGIRCSDLTVDQLAAINLDLDVDILDVAYNPRFGPDLSRLLSCGRTLIDVSTTAVDDFSLETLDAPYLDHLAAQCTGITDAGLVHLPPHLTKLNLAGTDISDVGLARIVTKAPGITELDLRAATGITADGLRQWLPGLANLRTLGVSPILLDHDLAEELDATTGIEHLLLGGPTDDDNDGSFDAIDVIGSATFMGTPI